MNRSLLGYLCDPADGSGLTLTEEKIGADGAILSGVLVGGRGRRYPIVDGVPRFVTNDASVRSFGDEWNYFNYDLFKPNWLKHVVGNNFDTPDFFRGKVIVDCGAGSGMQTRWMAEYGAEHVIALELSESVDGVMKANLAGLPNVDLVQCSIDQPPIKANAIDGLVLCHNVIQHTPSVERTANALWQIVAPGGEFAFTCYLRYPNSLPWMIRWLLVYRPLRAILSLCSFRTIMAYAETMARLRNVPGLGWFLERAQFVVRGDVPTGENYEERLYKNTVLNTFDWYGSHTYQHQLSAEEVKAICDGLRPPFRAVSNLDTYFKMRLPPGLAIRLVK